MVSQENAGVAVARNRGGSPRPRRAGSPSATPTTSPARDIPRRWSRHFDRHGGGIATSNCYWLFPERDPPVPHALQGPLPEPARQRLAILEQNFVSTMSLFPKALVEEIGPFDSELAVSRGLISRLRAIYAGHRVALQPRPLALYRWGSRALQPRRRGWTEHAEAVLRRVAERDDLTADEREYLERRLSGPGPAVLGRNGERAHFARSAIATRPRATTRAAGSLSQ